MKCSNTLVAAWLVVAPAALTVTAQDKQEEPAFKEQFKEQLEKWLPGMGAEKIPDRRDSQQKLQQACFELGTPGREDQRKQACKIIAETLAGELAAPARIWLLKQLEMIGREECVEAVAKSLTDRDPHVRDAARRALANNPAPKANAPLLAALPGSSGTWRVGLVNALGLRRDQASVGALVGLLRQEDRATVAAAAGALGKIGGSQATAALKAALVKAPDDLKTGIADAYLRCADRLLKEGKTQEAAAIYDELGSDEMPQAIRLAASNGKSQAAAKGGGK